MGRTSISNVYRKPGATQNTLHIFIVFLLIPAVLHNLNYPRHFGCDDRVQLDGCQLPPTILLCVIFSDFDHIA